MTTQSREGKYFLRGLREMGACERACSNIESALNIGKSIEQIYDETTDLVDLAWLYWELGIGDEFEEALENDADAIVLTKEFRDSSDYIIESFGKYYLMERFGMSHFEAVMLYRDMHHTVEEMDRIAKSNMPSAGEILKLKLPWSEVEKAFDDNYPWRGD